MPRLRIVSGVALLVACSAPRTTREQPAERDLMFDGHIDVAIHYARADWRLDAYDLAASQRGQTTLDAMRAGNVGGGLMTCGSTTEPGSGPMWPGFAACLAWARRLEAAHADRIVLARTVRAVHNANAAGKVAFMLAMEGGDQIDGDLGHIADLRDAGVRSFGIVYDHHNDLGDGAQAFVAAPVPPPHGGLSARGHAVVAALNDAGIVVDVAHSAESTAIAVTRASRFPVLASHTAAAALVATPRNVSDDVIRAIAATDGVVLVTFVPYLVSRAHFVWWSEGERTYRELVRAHPKDRDAVKQVMAAWNAAHSPPRTSIADVVEHVEHVARIAGKRHIGLGSDFDGMGAHVISDLADHRAVPRLVAALAARGWTRAELRGLLRENVLRVLAASER